MIGELVSFRINPGIAAVSVFSHASHIMAARKVGARA